MTFVRTCILTLLAVAGTACGSANSVVGPSEASAPEVQLSFGTGDVSPEVSSFARRCRWFRRCRPAPQPEPESIPQPEPELQVAAASVPAEPVGPVCSGPLWVNNTNHYRAPFILSPGVWALTLNHWDNSHAPGFQPGQMEAVEVSLDEVLALEGNNDIPDDVTEVVTSGTVALPSGASLVTFQARGTGSIDGACLSAVWLSDVS